MFDKFRRGLTIPNNKPQEICFTELFHALQTDYYKKILSGLTQTIALQANTTLPNYLVQITFHHTNTSVTLWLLFQHTCGDKAFIGGSFISHIPFYIQSILQVLVVSYSSLILLYLASSYLMINVK